MESDLDVSTLYDPQGHIFVSQVLDQLVIEMIPSRYWWRNYL